MSLPRYPEYKDSGVAWLGEVPGHWEVAALKRGFQVVGGSTPKSDNEAYWDGETIWVTPSDLSKLSGFGISDSQRKITTEGLASCGTTLVPFGSIILSTRAPIGSLAIADSELCTNQGCKALVPGDSINSHFYAYFLSIATGELNIRGKGTTFLELSGDELGSFKITFPTALEQTAIATFLDRETGKIDALVAEQEKLIALLKEKRQAVISHAVTKGLNPAAKMKDSGIEWLGEVPEHWKICALKRVCDVRDGTHGTPQYVEEAGNTFPLVTSKDLVTGKVLLDEAKHISEVDFQEIEKRSAVSIGDVLMPMIGSVGGAVIVDTDDKFSIKNVALFKQTDHCSSVWLKYVLNSQLANVQFDLEKSGGVQGFVALGTLRNLMFPMPSLYEQFSIISNLDRETTKLDALTAEAQRGIELLKERRSALISAAVTGKIDVRGKV